jgi:hypothetical protein
MIWRLGNASLLTIGQDAATAMIILDSLLFFVSILRILPCITDAQAIPIQICHHVLSIAHTLSIAPLAPPALPRLVDIHAGQ